MVQPSSSCHAMPLVGLDVGILVQGHEHLAKRTMDPNEWGGKENDLYQNLQIPCNIVDRLISDNQFVRHAVRNT